MVREVPGHMAGLILAQPPAGGLLGSVVLPAERREVALTPHVVPVKRTRSCGSAGPGRHV